MCGVVSLCVGKSFVWCSFTLCLLSFIWCKWYPMDTQHDRFHWQRVGTGVEQGVEEKGYGREMVIIKNRCVFFLRINHDS